MVGMRRIIKIKRNKKREKRRKKSGIYSKLFLHCYSLLNNNTSGA